MRSLLYAIVLLLVLIGSIALLRETDSGREAGTARPYDGPVATSDAPQPRAAHADGMPTSALVSLGEELLELWHPREAFEVLEQAAEADTLGSDVYARLAECGAHELVGREDDAREAWRRAAAHAAPEDSLFLDGLRGLFIDRDYGAAGESLAAALEGGGARDDAVYYLALAHFRAGRVDLARDQVEDALSRGDGPRGRQLALLTRILLARGETDAAAKRARELARAYPREPYPYVLLAQVDHAAGRTGSAVQFCNNALDIDARYVPAILTRSNLFADAGELAAARVGFEKLLLFDDPYLRSVGHEGIGFVSFLAGEFDVGTRAMDQAIRSAMLAGAVRRGLSHASRLVDYLCELGQPDSARAVVGRWVQAFGEAPEALGRVRVDILEGRTAQAREVLAQARASEEWRKWVNVMGLNTVELEALALIGEGENEKALALLDGGQRVNVEPGAGSRLAFLRAYAAFESGDAEAARESFAVVRGRFFGTEFPYRGDPVLLVQSTFYGAESALAAGDVEAALDGYRSFVESWGESPWELRALARARNKLSGPAATPR